MTDTNPLHTFAPHDLAGMFDVSVMTIRRWAEYHADHLSAGANPAPGQVRRFSWSDVETMRTIKAMRDSGLSVEAINVKLTEANAQSNTAVTMPVSVESLPTAQEAPQASTALVMALHDTIDTLQRRVGALEQRREPSFVVGLGLGAIGMGILFLLLIGLAVLYGVGR